MLYVTGKERRDNFNSRNEFLDTKYENGKIQHSQNFQALKPRRKCGCRLFAVDAKQSLSQAAIHGALAKISSAALQTDLCAD
jgi:hypothetical protein